jgi:hypothetical protein
MLNICFVHVSGAATRDDRVTRQKYCGKKVGQSGNLGLRKDDSSARVPKQLSLEGRELIAEANHQCNDRSNGTSIPAASIAAIRLSSFIVEIVDTGRHALQWVTDVGLTFFPSRRDTDATLSALTTLTQLRKRRLPPGAKSRPTVREIPISRQVPPLI